MLDFFFINGSSHFPLFFYLSYGKRVNMQFLGNSSPALCSSSPLYFHLCVFCLEVYEGLKPGVLGQYGHCQLRERESEREILYEEKKFRGPFEVIVICRGIVVKNPAC